jgi:O-antigen/teichoic acid export membrane protein
MPCAPPAQCKPAEMVSVSPSDLAAKVRGIFNDALYRGSLYLLLNTAATSAIGFVFWTLAAHKYSASTVGVFSGVTSGTGLLAAVAALSLPITMTRHIAGAENPWQLMLAAITIIATAGTALCLATVVFLGPHLPSALHIEQRGKMIFLLTALVVFTAVGGTLDAGLIAIRSSRTILIKNLIGSTVKLTAMILLATLRSSGLIFSFALGLGLATILSGIALGWQVRGKGAEYRTFRIPWRYLSSISRTYLATVIGILPLTIVPIEVLALRGAAETALFSVAFLIAGLLNYIPSIMGQVLFAEIARGGVPLGKQLRKARYAVYGLLLPSLALVLVAAPFILRLFGTAYATGATGCLRVLALSALPAGGTYLVDSILIARDRTAAYTLMQVWNAALILGFVGILLPRGLTAAASGLALGQVLTLGLGLLVVATGRAGRHHPRARTAPVEGASQHAEPDSAPEPVAHSAEPQIRELLAIWPMMPTMLIAEQIGWDQSVQALQEQVTELRLAYSHHYRHPNGYGYQAGDIAQCSLWFPPIEIPVGFGQTRSASQLPVLVMMTGYSRWLSAILIPSRRAEDLFAGWWQLIAELGAVPRTLTWHSEAAIGWEADGQSHVTAECRQFCHSLNTTVIVGGTDDPATTDLTEQAESLLERSFLPGRTFSSPADFNDQLRYWLRMTNAQSRPPQGWPPGTQVEADTQAMLPLPSTPPSTGWRLPVRVGERPFVHFDSNSYSVPPALRGRVVELVADLRQVRVLSAGGTVAHHYRTWAHGRTICDQAHRTIPRQPNRLGPTG